MSTPKRSIASDSIATFFYSTFSTVLGIAAGVLVARWLGPVGKGVFSGLALLQGGVAAVTGGIGASMTYLLTKKGRTVSQLATPLAVMVALVSTLTWVGLLIWGYARGFSPAWLVFFLSVPAATIVSWQGFLFLGLGRVRTLNQVALARGMLMILALFIAVELLRGGVTGSLIAWAIPIYASAVYVVIYTLRLRRVETAAHVGEDVKELIRFGSRSTLDGLLGFLNYRLDSLLIIAFLGAAGYGVYSVAAAGGEVLYTISRSVAAASAHTIGSSELRESALLTAKAVRTSLAVIGVLAAGLFLLAPWLIRLLYGGRFIAAVLPLRIMLPGVVAFAPAGIFSAFFSYQLGRPMFFVYLTLMLLAIETGGCLLFIPRFGLAGAALASTITYMVSTLGETWYFHKVTGVSPATLWLVTKDDISGLLRLVAPPAKA